MAGELDIATVPELAHELRKVEHCNVTVDLASTTFIDSSACGASWTRTNGSKVSARR